MSTGLAIAMVVSAAPAEARNRLSVVGNVAIENTEDIAPESDALGVATASGDFDGDGLDDLAVADRQHPGVIRIYRGNLWRIGTAGAVPFLFETAVLPTVPPTAASPNVALVAGDFDLVHDDDELVVGVPGDSQGTDGAGAVFFLNRSPNGTWAVMHTIRQGSAGYPGSADAGDHLGAALAIGQFNDDDLPDLAVGIPGNDFPAQSNAGVVMIVYGSNAGPSSIGAEVFFRGNNGLGGEPQPDEQFGFSLAAADFNGDTVDDLAIGIPGATCAGAAAAGGVVVLRGNDNEGGLAGVGATSWNQATSGVTDTCEAGDRFGYALAAGDFDRTPLGESRKFDLAIGVPFEAIDGVSGAGAVAVLHGTDAGLNAAGSTWLHEDLFPGGALRPALLGTSLKAVHFGSVPSSSDDLVIGLPFGANGGAAFAGALWIVPYGTNALDALKAQRWLLAGPLAAAPAQEGDGFGASITSGDYNGDGELDLAIGVPGHQVGAADGAGAVQVIYQSDFLFVDSFD
ncbi:MAG: FG-GAP repeat protein [Dokdonella sp.]|uniref:FG-GAP repeat protein n=1 Tax=Dokdonella sp. TaxID=2291710 RepID=UPI0032662550